MKKANSTLGFLRRNLKYCPEECKRLSYIAPVHSTLEYGAIVWDPYKLQDIQSIEKIQRQAARYIKNDYCSRFDGFVREMLPGLKLQPLQQRRLESRLVILYTILRDMVPAINADEVFFPLRNKRQIKPKSHQDCYSSNIISKYALNNSECYKVPASNTNQHKKSYFVKTTSDWNCLSDTQIRAGTVNSF